MPGVVCLLRGVNVGGNHKIKMDVLRGVCESLGMKNVITYLQSGNAVFECTASELPELAGRIESAIEKECGFRPPVILRTAEQMRHMQTWNLLSHRAAVEPENVVVFFLDADPGADAVKVVKAGREEVRHVGSEVFVYYPDGQGRSKLKFAKMPVNMTGRNWNTVNALIALVLQADAAASKK